MEKTLLLIALALTSLGIEGCSKNDVNTVAATNIIENAEVYKEVKNSSEELDAISIEILRTLYNTPCEGDNYGAYRITIEDYLTSIEDLGNNLKGSSKNEFDRELEVIRTYIHALDKIKNGDVVFENIDNAKQLADESYFIDAVSVPFYGTVLDTIVNHIEYNVNEGNKPLQGLEFLEGHLKYFAEQARVISEEDIFVDNEKLYELLCRDDIDNRAMETLDNNEGIHNPLRLGRIMFEYWHGIHVLTEGEDISPEDTDKILENVEDIKEAIQNNIKENL